MKKVIDLTNSRFGRWLVLSRGESIKSETMWNCVCDCGVKKLVSSRSLRKGSSKGCVNCGVVKHGFEKTRLYRCWSGMKFRVKDPAKKYLSLGIQVCSEWQGFISFKDWALANGYNDSLTLDRIDPLGNYEPSNCRWATDEQQQQNRVNTIKTLDGTPLIALARKNNISDGALRARLRLGWTLDKAANTPIKRKAA